MLWWEHLLTTQAVRSLLKESEIVKSVSDPFSLNSCLSKTLTWGFKYWFHQYNSFTQSFSVHLWIRHRESKTTCIESKDWCGFHDGWDLVEQTGEAQQNHHKIKQKVNTKSCNLNLPVGDLVGLCTLTSSSEPKPKNCSSCNEKADGRLRIWILMLKITPL